MSTAAAPPALLTVTDLEAMPDGRDFELIDGKLVERPPVGTRADWIGTELLRLLGNHVAAQRLGLLFGPSAGYQCFPSNPRTLRKPDVSFVRAGRFPGDQIPEGYARLAPDLAVEVVSPDDRAEDLTRKIEHFLSAGVRLVWVVHPSNRSIMVYRPDGSITGLRAGDELSGEDVIPGFRCRVGDLFPPPPPATAEAPATNQPG